jgi:modulator of FtsH protease HflK
VAWNKQTGGWKGNGGPWGQGPRNSGGGSSPPDLEELLRRSQDRLRRVLPGGGGMRNLSPLTIIAILGLAAAFIGYNFLTFRVDPNELGIVLQFGKYNRQADPGLHFRLPYPIETVFTPQVTAVHQVTIGQVVDDRNPNGGRDVPEESLMLTGDENIVDIDFSVFWLIGSSQNAQNYLFNMVDPDGTVKAAAESSMREVVGQSNIQDLLTQARQITESKVQALLQKTLDQFQAGVTITQVQLLKVDPPAEVVGSFRDVQAAQADQVRLQNEAQTYANQVVPQARGQSSQITNAASAFHDRIIAEAKGQAQAFNSVYQSYKTAPDVTRQRMYLEAMEQILTGKDKIILDESAAGSGVIPYLPLDTLRPAPPTPSTAPGTR